MHANLAITEEFILHRIGGFQGQDPLYMVGWEGVFGILITGIFIAIAQNTGCPFAEKHCTNGHIEDVAQLVSQLDQNRTILGLSLCFVLVAACFNAFGSLTVKRTSAAHRHIVEQMRVVFVWVFFLLY